MNFDFLSKTALFNGCPKEELSKILDCLNYSVKQYPKDHAVYHTGDLISEIGLILEGSVQIESVDIFGIKSILGFSEKGDVFAESYACIPGQPLMVDVLARENTVILFINVSSLFSGLEQNRWHSILIQNLLCIASRKNLRLSMRIFHSSPKTIRARLYSYFSEQVTAQKSTHFQIPLNRQQLADYLGVERTALSKELGKMQKEGLIKFHKNDFWLYL